MIKGFTSDHVPDQSGRTIMITGANAGLGFETAKVLAGKGARVLLACRSKERAEEAINAIHEEHSSADLAFVELDQASLESVRKAAKKVEEEKRLDVLVNNAGIMGPPYELTQDGFESQFGVNHLGTFALTGLLLPKLQETQKSRIVITSSLAHKGGKIHFGDINAEKRYRSWERYAQSKLANIVHATELNRRLVASGSETIVTCCHPGIASTELARHLPTAAQIFMPLVSVFLNTAAQGAWATLASAVGKGAVGGGYYGPKGFGEWSGKVGEASRSRRSRDENLGSKLWDFSVELTGVDPKI
ncbi:MAG: SDR family NAD(P)-dependent oxidoreductase [Parasphingorhabdus sp.]